MPTQNWDALLSLKRAMKLGRRQDKAAADLKAYAEVLYRKRGESIRNVLPDRVTIDEKGRVQVEGLDAWASGSAFP